MSSVQAAYPNSILSWTDRIDDVNIVYAIDPNTIAADLISVETVLGTNPQIEPSPPLGTPITYASLSARITDAMNNAQMPYVSLTQQKIACPSSSGGQLNYYRADFDPYRMHNGTDITFPCDGWWIVTSSQTWDWWDTGYSHFWLGLNGIGNILAEHLVDWEFPGNTFYNGVPGRWQLFGKRTMTSTVWWQGPAHKGDRISGVSENGTTNASQNVSNLSLKASCISRFKSGTTFSSG